MADPKKQLMTVVTGLGITLFGTVLGFLISQVTIVAQVAKHDSAIVYLQKNDAEFRAEMLQFRQEFTDRVKLLVDTVNNQTATARDLITLIKLQQGVKP